MKYLKILTPNDIRNFSKKECIICFLIYSFGPIIPGLIIINVHINAYLILLLCSFLVLLMGMASSIFIYRYSDESDILSKTHLGAPYQLRVKIFFMYLPGLALLFFIFSYFLGKINLGFILAFSFIIPSLTIFRTDVFNDSSTVINDEIVFGYNPSAYMIISVCLGLIGYYISFVSSSFIAIGLIFLIQLSLLFPDLINKYIPVDVRLKEYFLLFISIIFIIFLIIVIFLKSNFTLNFNLFSILRLVFFVILSIIFYKLYSIKINK